VDLSNVCITEHAADEDWLREHVQAPLDALTSALDNGAQATLPEPLDAPAVLAALAGLTSAMAVPVAMAVAVVGTHTGGDSCCSGGGGGGGNGRAGNAKKMVAAQQGMNMLARLWAVEDAAGGGKGREVLLASLSLAQALLTPASDGGGGASGASEGDLRDSLWPTGMRRLCEAAQARPQDTDFLMVRSCFLCVRFFCVHACVRACLGVGRPQATN
jgi:hypothetical protein